METEYRIKHKNGRWIWLHDQANLISEKDGITHAYGVFTDITSRKQMEQELRYSEEKYRLIVENAHDGVEITQGDKIIFTNTHFAEMLGYTVDELRNTSFMQIFTEKSKQDLYSRQKKREADNMSTGSYETTFLKKDGMIIDVDIKYEIMNFKGKPATFASISNITQRKSAEKARERALIEAQGANKVKDQFIANISHEIRTPLNSLLGFTDLVKQRYLEIIPEKDQKVFKYITDAGNRLMQTIDSMLNISQITAGVIKAHKQELDLSSTVAQAVAKFKQQAESKALVLRAVIPKQPTLIYADEFCIHEAISHLIRNAIKYTKEGTIELMFGHKEDRTTLSIIDTGIGISEEYQKRLFDPYTQESEGFTKKYQGLGLGLALTKHYLDLNNIDLEFESKQDKGTTFILIFPKI